MSWACVTGVTASICVSLHQSSTSILRLAVCSVSPGACSVNPRLSQRRSTPVERRDTAIPLSSLSPQSKSFGVVDDDEHGKSWFKNHKKIVNQAALAQHTGYTRSVMFKLQNHNGIGNKPGKNPDWGFNHKVIDRGRPPTFRHNEPSKYAPTAPSSVNQRQLKKRSADLRRLQRHS
ncbi:hypothetical protein DFH08DRAFT_936945, partial [Mycena albidolilacea]